MFKVSFSGLRERDVASDLKKSLFCIWFQLVVIILCFATLLVSTAGTAGLKKDEYEISIKHGSFAVHQRHVNAEGTSRSGPSAPTLAPGSATGSAAGSASAGGESAALPKEGERISTTLSVPRPTVQSAKGSSEGSASGRKPMKSIEFGAEPPTGSGRSSSYQKVEYYGASGDAKETTVQSSQDFYNTPQLRDRGPVRFASSTTSTTTAKPLPGKRYKSIPKSAVEQNEEIYLLLKYEHPRKPAEEARKAEETIKESRPESVKASELKQGKGRQNAESQDDDFLQEGLRAGGSFTTVGYYVSDAETTTTTPMTPTASKGVDTLATVAPTGRGASNRLRNSYGDYIGGDLRDFEDAIRPIEENVDETAGSGEEEDGEDVTDGDGENNGPMEIDGDVDVIEMTRILAGRQGGLTIAEFNRLFKDYLKKEISVQDLEDFKKLEQGEEPAKEDPVATDPTKSFDIREENGKKTQQKTGQSLAGPTAAQKQQLDRLKVLINKGSLKAGRKDKVVKIGYGGSKSYQGVYKSQKFLEKVKSERTPTLTDGLWGGSEYRQQQPMREIGPMAYVDNPVFGFVPGGRSRKVDGQKPIGASPQGGQSYVKFQKIS
ncbi:uncharacterized protein LOC128726999 [Anopheles nili]|uniref:uncharacterized protein LOC128726999 n=1 Tax=Anopheles nili TaxID=185578 RepID=UPI00237B4B71|nr:uncharacterized protein LOC128726999 [Anopheles nili]